MKKNFFALLLTGLTAVAFASCQRGYNMNDLQPDKEKTAAAKKSKTLRLQSITVENSPFAEFTYDQKGRLSAVVTYLDSTTYAYQGGGVEFRTISKFSKEVISYMSAKLGANGYVRESSGYNIIENKRVDFMEVYTYDGLGQLVNITKKTSVNGAASNSGEQRFEWKDGNLITYTAIGGDGVEVTHFDYDLSKKDQTGVWAIISGTWSDSFFGKRSTHHMAGVSVEKDGVSKKLIDYAWQLDVAGYATSCTWKVNDNDKSEAIAQYNYQ